MTLRTFISKLALRPPGCTCHKGGRCLACLAANPDLRPKPERTPFAGAWPWA